MIPEHIVERIRDATNIVELVSGYVQLKRRGQNYVGLCPFHTEKTPSFNVNPGRQIFHCFGCGKGGDAIGFLMEHERMGFVDAAKMLAERAHIEIPQASGGSDSASERIHGALAFALEYFTRALEHEEVGAPARIYLNGREIPAEMRTRFAVGYAPDRARGLLRYAEKRGLGLRDLEQAGLVLTGRERAVDRFVNRLIFPIRNLSGRPIAFGGRDLSGSARAKYLNSPETAVYRKGRVLYGLHESKRAIQDAGEVLICEGYFDLLRLHEHGFENSVAVSGTALTPDQGRLLARFAQRAWLLFDADGPGLQAALRSVPVLFDAGLDVSIVNLGAGEDPDTLLQKQGAETLRDRLGSARDYAGFLEDQAGAPFASLSPAHQDRLIGEIAATVACISDPVRKDLVARSAWSRLGVTESVFRARIAATVKAPGRNPVDAPLDPGEDSGAAWQTELLQLLVVDPTARASARAQIGPDDFRPSLYRELVKLLFGEEYVHMEAGALMRAATQPELSALIGRLAGNDSDHLSGRLDDYLRKVSRLRLGKRSRRLLQELQAAESRGDKVAVAELSQAYQKVRRDWLDLGRLPCGPEPGDGSEE